MCVMNKNTSSNSIFFIWIHKWNCHNKKRSEKVSDHYDNVIIICLKSNEDFKKRNKKVIFISFK